MTNYIIFSSPDSKLNSLFITQLAKSKVILLKEYSNIKTTFIHDIKKTPTIVKFINNKEVARLVVGEQDESK